MPRNRRKGQHNAKSVRNVDLNESESIVDLISQLPLPPSPSNLSKNENISENQSFGMEIEEELSIEVAMNSEVSTEKIQSADNLAEIEKAYIFKKEHNMIVSKLHIKIDELYKQQSIIDKEKETIAGELCQMRRTNVSQLLEHHRLIETLQKRHEAKVELLENRLISQENEQKRYLVSMHQLLQRTDSGVDHLKVNITDSHFFHSHFLQKLDNLHEEIVERKKKVSTFQWILERIWNGIKYLSKKFASHFMRRCWLLKAVYIFFAIGLISIIISHDPPRYYCTRCGSFKISVL